MNRVDRSYQPAVSREVVGQDESFRGRKLTAIQYGILVSSLWQMGTLPTRYPLPQPLAYLIENTKFSRRGARISPISTEVVSRINPQSTNRLPKRWPITIDLLIGEWVFRHFGLTRKSQRVYEYVSAPSVSMRECMRVLGCRSSQIQGYRLHGIGRSMHSGVEVHVGCT